MARAGTTPDRETSAAPVPDTRDLTTLHAAAAGCRACPLWKTGTQTVFGEGDAPARILVVGEQPGDREDRAGRPFIGPAGQLLDQALEAAGLERRSLYVTNAVKHFKWVARGKRRLHEKPDSLELAACRPWLEAEVRAVGPEAILCLGATAARAVCGRAVKVLSERGTWRESVFGVPALVTVHPAALLRLRDRSQFEPAFAELVADLKKLSPARRIGPTGLEENGASAATRERQRTAVRRRRPARRT